MSGMTAVAVEGAREVTVDDFDAFYAANFTSLTTQLYAYFGDRQEAQDVVQEAFCRALARWRRISTYDDPVAWVRRVAWNLATSNVRRARVASAFRRRHREEPAPAPNPNRVALLAALRTLPAKQRQATVLHYLADLPISEIAASMGATEGTVKSWLHRARTALADQLTPTTEEGRHA
jgi:RNA polymerase sigma-70 factor (ECF subfamily)